MSFGLNIRVKLDRFSSVLGRFLERHHLPTLKEMTMVYDVYGALLSLPGHYILARIRAHSLARVVALDALEERIITGFTQSIAIEFHSFGGDG